MKRKRLWYHVEAEEYWFDNKDGSRQSWKSCKTRRKAWSIAEGLKRQFPDKTVHLQKWFWYKGRRLVSTWEIIAPPCTTYGNSSSQAVGEIELSQAKEYIKEQSLIFEEFSEYLLENYLDKYVLFEDGRVLDSGDNYEEVSMRAHKQFRQKLLFIKKVTLSELTYKTLTPLPR